jgi:hypothetical protein
VFPVWRLARNGYERGRSDLSFAVLHRVPLGAVRGRFTVSHMADTSSGQLVALPTPVVLPFKGTECHLRWTLRAGL